MSHGINLIAYAIGGYLLLMTLVQLRLLPRYLKLRFSPGFWAFTFSYAIAITPALEWITRTNPPGATGYALAAIAGITVLIAAIAARTVIAVAQRQLATQPGDCLPRPRTPVPDSSSESQRAGGEHK